MRWMTIKLMLVGKNMGLELSIQKCGVFHLEKNSPKHAYILADEALPDTQIAKDLGIRFCASLNFREQADRVLRRFSMLCCWILRMFTIEQGCTTHGQF